MKVHRQNRSNTYRLLAAVALVVVLGVGGAPTAAAASEDVQIGVNSGQQKLHPGDEPFPIRIGATNMSDGYPDPVEGVTANVSIIHLPTDRTIHEETVTTGSNGTAVITFNPIDHPGGEYQVRAESDDSVGYDPTQIGRVTDDVAHGDLAYIGEELNVTVHTTDAGTPVEGATNNIEVSGPNGVVTNETVQTGEDGFAQVSFTPTTAGRYEIRNGTTGNRYQSIEVRHYQTRSVTGDGDSWQLAGSQVDFAGVLVNESGPVPNETIEFTAVSGQNRKAIENISVTTTENGLYRASLEAPDRAKLDIQIVRITPDGERLDANHEIHLRNAKSSENTGDGNTGGGGAGGLDFQATIESEFESGPNIFQRPSDLAPRGSNVSVDVTLEEAESNEPVANQTVTAVLTAGHNPVPVTTVTLETDTNGHASTNITVPQSLPETVDLKLHAKTSYNGTTYDVDADGPAVQQYVVGRNHPDLTPNATNTLTYEAQNATGSPVSGVPITGAISGNQFYGPVRTDSNVTNAAGRATLTFDVPSVQEAEMDLNTVHQYRRLSVDSSLSFEESSDNADLTIGGQDGGPTEVVSGSTVNVTYDTPKKTTGVVGFQGDFGGSSRMVYAQSDETVQLDIPEMAQVSEFQDIFVYAVGPEGTVYRDNVGLDVVRKGPTAHFHTKFWPPTSVGESKTLDASSARADNVTNYEWTFPNGETMNTTKSSVTHAFETAGDRTVTLTITNASGATDSFSRTIPVTSGAPLSVDLIAPDSAEANRTVTLKANATGTPTEYHWDLNGDGTIDDTTDGPTHNLSAPMNLQSYPTNRTVGVTVVNSSGATISDTATITIEDGNSPPAAPTGLSAENVTNSSFDLEWDSVAGASSYEITLNGDNITETTELRATLSDLDADTTYEVAVVAIADARRSKPATMTVRTAAEAGPPPIDGVQPTDPNGDSLYEDFSGDGDIDFPDVNTFFQHSDTDVIQNNTQFFDFTDDGTINLQDVMVLFRMV